MLKKQGRRPKAYATQTTRQTGRNQIRFRCDHKGMQFLPQRPAARVCLLAVFLTGFIAMAQQMTVATLKGFIKSAIQLKNPDKDVASSVLKFKMTEKFTLADLQELQDAGVGEKTLT